MASHSTALRSLKKSVKAVRSWWFEPLIRTQEATLQAVQAELALRHKQASQTRGPLPHLGEVGFRVYSDHDEDGILLYLFALAGAPKRRLVDLGAASHTASNSANLILHRGWTGLLVDADEGSAEAARAFYGHHPATRDFPPKITSTFLTMENVNGILQEHGVVGEVDLLSIDVDGMDYWLWRALDVITPRVVVVEFQDILGWERAVTVPYSPDFRAYDHGANRHTNDYSGASLAAMVKLGREKGYRMVGVNRLGFNAFFVRDDVAPDLLPEVEPRACLTHPWNEYGMRVRYPRVESMEWVEV